MNAKSKLKTIIREEYKRAKLINNINYLIVEQNKNRYQWNSDRAVNDYPDVENIKEAGKYLDALPGRKKVSYLNTYRYIVSLPGVEGKIGEKFYIYPDGDVSSVFGQQDFKWVWEDDKVKIVNPNGTMVGALEKDKSSTALDLSDEETSEGGSWLDTAQTVADWAGLVPVFGDFIDIINAIVYFAREKWLDGALSALAIIPVIGSPVKLGIKNAIKAAKGGAKLAKKVIKQAADPNAVKNFWIAVMDTGKFDRKLLKQLGEEGLPYVSKIILETKDFAKKYKFDSKEVLELLTQLDTFMKNSRQAILELAKKEGKKFATDVASTYSKEGLQQLASRITVLKPGKIFAGERGFSLLNFSKLFNWATVNKSGQNRLASLFKMDPNKIDTITNSIVKQFDNDLADPKNIDRLLSIGRTLDFNVATKMGKTGTNVIQRLNSAQKIDQFKKSLLKLPPADYKKFAENITVTAKNGDNFVYNAMLANTGYSLKNILDPKGYVNALFKDKKIASTINKMAMDYKSSIKAMDPKAYDIWSNEIQEILDDAGYNFDSQTDNYDSVFIATLLGIISIAGSAEASQTINDVTAEVLIGLIRRFGVDPKQGQVFKGAVYTIVDNEKGNTKAEKKANARKKLKTKDLQDSYDEIMKDYEETEEFEF